MKYLQSHFWLLRFALLVLLLLAGQRQQASAASLPYQQDTPPRLEVEAVQGETVVWLHRPENDVWQPLTLPSELDAEQVDGAILVNDVIAPTVVGTDGNALAVYRPGENGAAGILEPVPVGYLRLENGEWVHWTEGAWKPSGPPAGDNHPLSWAVQAFVNEHHAALRLHYAVVLNRGGSQQRFELSDEQNRYALAVALIAASSDGTVMHVPLLVRLGEGKHEVLDVRGLVRNNGARWPYSSIITRSEFLSVAYWVDPLRTGTSAPSLRFVIDRETEEQLILIDLQGDGEWQPLRSDGGWIYDGAQPIFHDPEVARLEDVRAAMLLSPSRGIVRQPTEIMSALLTTTTGLPREQVCDLPRDWAEQPNGQFVIISPIFDRFATDAEPHPIDAALQQEIIPQIRTDMPRFQRLFEATLSAPIAIRIYPTRADYHCLNAIAPQLPPGRFHTLIGAREIALIGDELDVSDAIQRQSLLNAIRYQLAALFVAQVSDGAAQPGLQAAIAAYAQNPQQVWDVANADVSSPRLDWRFLWEEEVVGRSAVIGREAMTTVAYLVDGHGWLAFRDFLASLASASNYRQALSDAFGADMLTLQQQWRRYHRLYFDQRWQANVFYGYDLTVYEMLVDAGAYADAAASLNDAITFLETVESGETLTEARALLAAAEQGMEAAELVRQTRRALQEGRYEESVTLADHAESIYRDLSDGRRLQEIDLYRSRAQEVLSLQGELAELTAGIEEADETSVRRLQELSQRLGTLGDNESAAEADRALQAVEARHRREAQIFAERLLLVVGALLLVRLVLLWRGRPPEARLT